MGSDAHSLLGRIWDPGVRTEHQELRAGPDHFRKGGQEKEAGGCGRDRDTTCSRTRGVGLVAL